MRDVGAEVKDLCIGKGGIEREVVYMIRTEGYSAATVTTDVNEFQGSKRTSHHQR
jgi:hypothetical protein